MILKLLIIRHALNKVTNHLLNSLIVYNSSKDHEERYTYLERQIVQTHTTRVYKELDNELKYLSERLVIIDGSVDTLVKQSEEDYEDTREMLQHQLLVIITRLSKVEDNTSKLYI